MHCGVIPILLLSGLNFVNLQEFNDAEESLFGPNEEDDEWEDVEPEVPKYEIPKGVQTLTIGDTKPLSDENTYAFHMPTDLKCDGCRIVAIVMKKGLKRIQDRYEKGHRLAESVVVDLMDNVCTGKDSWEGYGIKEIEGKRRLSGEGLETKDVPGVMQGGGRWPNRLQQMCLEYVGEMGEDLVYDVFMADRSLEDLFCRSKELNNICPLKKRRKKVKAKEATPSKNEL